MSEAVNQVLFGRLKRLRHTYRYSAQPVIERENVAEHSFWTAMIAMTISFDVSPDDHHLAKEVAVRSLVHDIEECVTGDLVRDVKYATPQIRRTIRNIEEVFVKSLLTPMGEIGSIIESYWQTSKDDTIAGEIVKLADMLCVISYCTQEMELGNRSLLEIKEECVKLIVRTIKTPELITLAHEAINEADFRWSNNSAKG